MRSLRPASSGVALAIAAFAAACGGDPDVAREGARALPDGTRVDVADDGSLTLRAGDRELLATAPGRPFVVRDYETITSWLLGSFTFSRDAEVAVEIGQLEGARREGDTVVVDYRGAGDAALTVVASVAAAGEATRLELSVSGVPGGSSIAVPLRCDEESTFYGFGEQYAAAEHRGQAFDLFVGEQGIGRTAAGDSHRTYYPMPWWLDARGVGVLAETHRRALVDLCATDPEVAWLEVEQGEELELLVFHGPSPLDVVRQLGARVGRPLALPAWAFEPWIAIQGGRDAVLAEADLLEAAGIDAGALWAQDWTGARTNFGGGYGVQYRWVADDTLYPDLRDMTDQLHARGYRFLAYANPFVMPALDHFAPMEADGLLIRDATGGTYLHASPAGDASHPDFTRAETWAYVEGALGAMVRDLGIDGWMADFGEWVPLDAVLADGSDPVEYHNRFPELWHRASRNALLAERPDGDFVFFSRSGWTGDQAAAQVTWAGDQEATWSEHDGLPTVVPALLTLGLSAVPYVTHDIAGFSNGPSTQELYQRWTELGALTPIFRTHEGNRRADNWSWKRDAETTAHFRRMTRLHAALRATFATLAAEAETTSAPILRHLMLEHPSDATARAVHDQFLIGSELLAAPVLVEGAVRRRVYLPAGRWHHVWSGDAHDGPGYVEVAASIGEPPLFALGAPRPDLRVVD